MLYFDRIDVSKGIEVNKTSKWKECDICHYWHILNKGCKFQLYVCNRYHDLVMMSMNLAILLFDTLKVLIIACWKISKSETINLMQNIDLTKKKRLLAELAKVRPQT